MLATEEHMEKSLRVASIASGRPLVKNKKVLT